MKKRTYRITTRRRYAITTRESSNALLDLVRSHYGWKLPKVWDYQQTHPYGYPSLRPPYHKTI